MLLRLRLLAGLEVAALLCVSKFGQLFYDGLSNAYREIGAAVAGFSSRGCDVGRLAPHGQLKALQVWYRWTVS
jgi:hypothetical protein